MGEKVVLRVLDPGNTKLNLEKLGFSDEQKQHYLDALHRQQGLILVTGPTGSGKSLSLYAGLSLLNTQVRNIATVEDPVEIHLEGVNQVAINPGGGLGFCRFTSRIYAPWPGCTDGGGNQGRGNR